MASRERMSSVDTAWLRMDRPTNLMMIVGVMVFQGGSTSGACATPSSPHAGVPALSPSGGGRGVRLLLAGRSGFRSRRPPAPRTPARQGRQESCRLAGRELAAQPLNPNRPLWGFDLIEYRDRRPGHGRAHPSQHRRRHRAGGRHPFADRRFAARAGQAAPVAADETNEEAPRGRRRSVLGNALGPGDDATSASSGLLPNWAARRLILCTNPDQVLAYAAWPAARGEVAKLAIMPDDATPA